jgi:hypothetical protein
MGGVTSVTRGGAGKGSVVAAISTLRVELTSARVGVIFWTTITTILILIIIIIIVNIIIIIIVIIITIMIMIIIVIIIVIIIFIIIPDTGR